MKKEFLFLVLSLFLSIYRCISYVELGLAQESDIVISSDNSFVNEIGNLHVVGEVETSTPFQGLFSILNQMVTISLREYYTF